MVNLRSSKAFKYNKYFIVVLFAALVAALFFTQTNNKREPDSCLARGCQNGIGTFVMQNARYMGRFVNGQFNGQGVLAVSDGRKYEGAWQDNLPQGFGTQVNPDGTIYVGEWEKRQVWRPWNVNHS